LLGLLRAFARVAVLLQIFLHILGIFQ